VIRKRTIAAAALLAAAFALPSRAEAPRVVSLDYCADQYVLALADRDRILGVSTGPDDAYSAMRARAAGLPVLRDTAEDVVTRNPDLILRSYGGGPRARRYYERLGYEVLDIGFAQSFEDIARTVRRVAKALDRPARGEALVREMEKALADAGASAGGDRPEALYVTPGGVTTGAGTMVHEILTAAGFENVAARDGGRGWQDLPLEALVLDPPDLIVTGFFDMPAEAVDNWSPTRHPALRGQMARTPTIHLDGARLSCGAWFMATAALDARRQADALFPDEAPGPLGPLGPLGFLGRPGAAGEGRQ
jgi:iron complex transport system substrate-binding protein